MSQPDDLSPDELLSETAWVRGLARGLLGPGAEADDAAQLTWLAARGRSADRPARRRSWLAGVLRHTVRHQARGEGRRRRYEQAAAREASARRGTAPATDDLAARAELQQRLARQVLALEEPFRSTVLLRYFGGHSVRRIAARLDCPPATVRTRLHRALGRLRQRLDDGSPDWLPALVGLAAPARHLTLGGWLMTKTKLWAGAAVLAALGTTAWWLSAPLPDPAADGVLAPAPVVEGPPTTGAPSPAAPLTRPLAASPPPPSEAEPEAGATADASPWDGDRVRFDGRVVDAEGRPVPEARVVFLPSLRNLRRADTTLRRELLEHAGRRLSHSVTDEQGRYQLDARHASLDPGELPAQEFINELVFPELVVHAAGRARVAHVLRGWDGGDRRVPDIVIGPGGSLRGRVVDGDGRPVAGVQVHGPFFLAAEAATRSDDVEQKGHAADFLVDTTDADGRFALHGTSAGRGPITLDKPGFLRSRLPSIELPTSGTRDLGEIVLQSGAWVSGRVVDTAGQPLVGAAVMAREPSAGARMGDDTILAETIALQDSADAARSGPEGAFTLGGLEGEVLTLWAIAAGHEPERLTGVRPGADDLTVVLRPQARLEVEVVSARGGAAVPDAVVRAWRPSGRPDDLETALEVVVPEVAGDVHVVERPGRSGTRLLVRAPGFADAIALAPGVEAPRVDRHVVRLVAEARWEGRVLDQRGLPVAGARLTLVPAAPEPDVPRDGVGRPRHVQPLVRGAQVAARRRVTTDEAGRFVFTGLAAGPYALEVLADGLLLPPEASHAEVAAGEHRTADLALLAAGTVSGRVLGVDGRPRSGHGLILQRQVGGGAAPIHRGMTDEGGHFVVGRLPPGPYRLQADESTYLDCDVLAGRTTEVVVQLRRRPRITGRAVRDDSGEAVPGAVVELGRPRQQDGREVWSQFESTRTDAQGHFELEGPWAGGFVLRTHTPDGALAPDVPVDLTWDHTTEVRLAFVPGRIAGRLVDEQGAPVAEGWVTLGPRGRARGTSDAEGRFTFEWLAPGRYEVHHGAAGHVSLDTPQVTLAPDAAIDDLVLTLVPAAALTGRVAGADGVAVRDGTFVELRRADTDSGSRRTRTADGAFRFDSVRPGAYELIVGNTAQASFFQDDAWILWREPLELTAGPARHLEVVVEP